MKRGKEQERILEEREEFEMNVYLVKGRIRRHDYMAHTNAPNTSKDLRIVFADTIEEAGKKYEKFWEDQSVEYSHSYSVYDYDITEALK